MMILLPETQKTYSEYECIGEIDMRPVLSAIGCSVWTKKGENRRQPEEATKNEDQWIEKLRDTRETLGGYAYSLVTSTGTWYSNAPRY